MIYYALIGFDKTLLLLSTGTNISTGTNKDGLDNLDNKEIEDNLINNGDATNGDINKYEIEELDTLNVNRAHLMLKNLKDTTLFKGKTLPTLNKVLNAVLSSCRYMTKDKDRQGVEKILILYLKYLHNLGMVSYDNVRNKIKLIYD